MADYPQTLFTSIDEARIRGFVTERQEENLHLEFKTARVPLSKDDRINFAVALSGFSNADGGVVVWGIDTERKAGQDHASKLIPINSVSHLVAQLNEFTGDAVNPLVDGVQHKRIDVGSDTGFAVTLVPASASGPHMAKQGENCYYKRSGSRFAQMEHYEVADMFGRRNRPDLKLSYRVGKHTQSKIRDTVLTETAKITLVLKNSGRGSAKAPFLDVSFHPGIFTIDLAKPLHSGPSGSLVKPLFLTNSRLQFVGFADFVIHPGVEYDLAELVPVGQLVPYSTLEVVCRFAAEDYPLNEVLVSISTEELRWL